MARKKSQFVRLTHQFIDKTMRELGPITSCVALVLLRYTNKDLQSFPSQKRIAEMIGASEISVKRAIKLLEERGDITIERVPTTKGRRNINTLTTKGTRYLTDTYLGISEIR
jgi:DNA-binding MarR family transcriptional regulator